MRRSIAVLSFATLLACGSLAEAHPGHAVEASDSNSMTHYLTHPDHILWWVVVAVVIATGIVTARALRRKPAPAYAPVRSQRSQRP